MMMSRSSAYLYLRARRRSQYSRAAVGSWIEQGPTMTRRRCRGSVSWSIATDSLRAFRTVCFEVGDWGISCCRRSGGVRGLYPRTAKREVVLVRMRKIKIGGVCTSPIFQPLFVAHMLILDVELSVSQ